MIRISARAAAATAGAAAAAALGIAFSFEWWGGLVPCPMCLMERWPYRVAIVLGVLGAVLPRPAPRLALVALLATGLVAVAASGAHVGVEFGWWPSPLPACAAPNLGSGSIAERLQRMPVRPSKPCEDPVYPLPWLPLSFAELDLLFALALSSGIALSLSLNQGRRR
jgi:disulfide bond formation protein DsbB